MARMERISYSKYVISFGGRENFDVNEDRDCCVRALVHALEIPYAEAHAKLADWGRKPRKGTYGFTAFMAKNVPFIEHHTRYTASYYCGGKEKDKGRKVTTLRRFIKDFPEGHWVISVKGHAFAVINGMIHDAMVLRPGVLIIDAWRVK